MGCGCGGGAVGIAALLAAAAAGYFVCAKAAEEKKGSNLRAVGTILGVLIIALSLLATACIVARKAGYTCPILKKMCAERHGMPGEMGKMPYPGK